MLCAVCRKEGILPVCGARHCSAVINHLAPCRPRHSPAPSLHLPPAALRLGSLLPVPGARVRDQLCRQTKKHTRWCAFLFGGEGGIRFSAEKPVAALTVHRTVIHYRSFESRPINVLQNNKSTHCVDALLFWRRRRDSNPRAGFPTYTLSRGASSAYLSTSPNR